MTEQKDEAVQRARQAMEQTSDLGPGTAGYTTSGAAYRGMEIAADTGQPSPADRGFSNRKEGKLGDDGPA